MRIVEKVHFGGLIKAVLRTRLSFRLNEIIISIRAAASYYGLVSSDVAPPPTDSDTTQLY